MITFLLIAVLALIVIAAIIVANTANQRKRAGQSDSSTVLKQQTGTGSPKVGRPTGEN